MCEMLAIVRHAFIFLNYAPLLSLETAIEMQTLRWFSVVSILQQIRKISYQYKWYLFELNLLSMVSFRSLYNSIWSVSMLWSICKSVWFLIGQRYPMVAHVLVWCCLCRHEIRAWLMLYWILTWQFAQGEYGLQRPGNTFASVGCVKIDISMPLWCIWKSTARRSNDHRCQDCSGVCKLLLVQELICQS